MIEHSVPEFGRFLSVEHDGDVASLCRDLERIPVAAGFRHLVDLDITSDRASAVTRIGALIKDICFVTGTVGDLLGVEAAEINAASVLRDRTLETFSRQGAGWFWCLRKRGFALKGPAIGPYPTSYSAYRGALMMPELGTDLGTNGLPTDYCAGDTAAYVDPMAERGSVNPIQR